MRNSDGLGLSIWLLKGELRIYELDVRVHVSLTWTGWVN